MLIKAGKKRLITGKNRQEERRIQQMLQMRIANRMSGSISTEIERAMNSLVDSYIQTGGSTELFGLKLDEHEKELQKVIEAEWTTAARMGGERIIGSAKCIHGNYYTKNDSMFDDFMARVQMFISTFALSRVTGLTETTTEDVRNRILQGTAANMTVDEIAKGIREIAPQISGYRSMMIARTEGHAAYSFGTQTGAEASSLMMQKEWISSNDGRTRDKRFDHRGADGETVNLSDYFQETGERLRYPGDPSGSAGNVIHCRCCSGQVII